MKLSLSERIFLYCRSFSYNSGLQQLGFGSKNNINFLHKGIDFLTITYKPLKTNLLWASRLLIVYAFVEGISLAALFQLIF